MALLWRALLLQPHVIRPIKLFAGVSNLCVERADGQWLRFAGNTVSVTSALLVQHESSPDEYVAQCSRIPVQLPVLKQAVGPTWPWGTVRPPRSADWEETT